jgi:uncharacterized protein (DUF2147 family)
LHPIKEDLMKLLRTMQRLMMGATAGIALAASAQSPVGLWKTIDDATGKEKSLVRITESGGVLSGKVEKSLDPDAKPDQKCDECTDGRKGQPIIGMTIIRNIKKGERERQWDGGDILDPNNGKVYRLRLTPSDDNKKLDVRGYFGTPMLGRSQTWLRVE